MDATSIPLGDLIATIGLSVAEAQQTIDATALEHFAAVYDTSALALEHLRAIGYQPTWYQVSEASADVVVAITVRREASATSPVHRVHAAHVDARYRSTYTHTSSARSALKFRIVPVPPPANVS